MYVVLVEQDIRPAVTAKRWISDALYFCLRDSDSSRSANEEETKEEEDNDKNQVKVRVQHLAGADKN
jgi:hypothetical protein